MTPGFKSGRAALLSVLAGLALWLPGWTAAQPVQPAVAAEQGAPQRLSRTQARDYGRSLLAEGQLRAARAVAQGLLQADPADFEALLILSRAEARLGHGKAAIAAAGRAWAAAPDLPEEGGQSQGRNTPEAAQATPSDPDAAIAARRYIAAYTMAQAHDAAGQYMRGQFWLRRAGQHAPQPALRQLAREEFGKMEARNPLDLTLRASVSPNSNINNGSLEAWRPDALPFVFRPEGAARPLSGLEGAVAADLSWRLATGARHETSLTGSLDYRDYVLSSEAKRIAPEAEGGDFAFGRLALGARHRIMAQDGQREYSIGAETGRSWYGGDPRHDFLSLQLGVGQKLTPRDILWTHASVETQIGAEGRQDVERWVGSLSWNHLTQDRAMVVLGLTGLQSRSHDQTLDYRQIVASAQYHLAEPVYGVALGLGLSLSHRRHDAFPFMRDGQSDTEASARVMATFTQVDYMGYVPMLTLSARRSVADVPLYETEAYGLTLGLRSTF